VTTTVACDKAANYAYVNEAFSKPTFFILGKNFVSSLWRKILPEFLFFSYQYV